MSQLPPGSPSYPPPQDETTILDIVRRARDGDDTSFTVLYHWYYSHIYNYLVRLVGNRQDASDLVQETFVRAWRGLPGIYDGRRFRGWLYKIATNLALDHLRRKKREKAICGNAGMETTEEPTARFEGRVEERELVRLALEQVAPKPRACLLMQQEGFSQT